MKRPGSRSGLLAALLVAALVGAGTGRAQEGVPEAAGAHANLGSAGEVSDVPAGPARIVGRLVHRTHPEAQAGVQLALFALSSDGRAGARRTVSDSDGGFRFENISNDPGTVYLIGLRYADIPFGERVVFEPGQLEQTITIAIADTSRDTAALAIGPARLRIDRGCSGIRVTERHTLVNGGDTVLYVPPAERGTGDALFRIPLPTGASFFEANQLTAEEGLEKQGEEVLFYGPLHPGHHTVEFGYSLNADSGSVTVERRFPLGTEGVTVLTWAGGPPAHGAAFEPGDTVNLGSVRYGSVTSGPVAPGGSVSFSVDVGTGAADARGLSLAELRVFLELDDAALDVSEEYTVAVSGDTPLESRSDAPLLCLSLPPEAQELRFSADTFTKGVQPDANGGISLRGPFPPGESTFALSYLLPHGKEGARFEQSFPTELSLLSMFIADTGVLVKTDRLHRRRPVETRDRVYLQLEGFQIAAGEPVRVDLSSLPPRKTIPSVVRIGFVGLASIVALAFLVAPLRRSPGRPAAAVSTASADERAAVYAAIRDLEDDFETGKISAEDRGVMLAELRARAATLLREERARSAPEDTETPAPSAGSPSAAPAPAAATRTCGRCGAPLAAAARFCSRCGAEAAAPPDSGDAPA